MRRLFAFVGGVCASVAGPAQAIAPIFCVLTVEVLEDVQPPYALTDGAFPSASVMVRGLEPLDESMTACGIWVGEEFDTFVPEAMLPLAAGDVIEIDMMFSMSDVMSERAGE